MCEDKFEFKRQRRKLTLLARPLLVSNRLNFAINRPVNCLTVAIVDYSATLQLLQSNDIHT